MLSVTCKANLKIVSVACLVSALSACAANTSHKNTSPALEPTSQTPAAVVNAPASQPAPSEPATAEPAPAAPVEGANSESVSTPASEELPKGTTILHIGDSFAEALGIPL